MLYFIIELLYLGWENWYDIRKHIHLNRIDCAYYIKEVHTHVGNRFWNHLLCTRIT